VFEFEGDRVVVEPVVEEEGHLGGVLAAEFVF
jgi:hypothetical protein